MFILCNFCVVEDVEKNCAVRLNATTRFCNSKIKRAVHNSKQQVDVLRNRNVRLQSQLDNCTVAVIGQVMPMEQDGDRLTECLKSHLLQSNSTDMSKTRFSTSENTQLQNVLRGNDIDSDGNDPVVKRVKTGDSLFPFRQQSSSYNISKPVGNYPTITNISNGETNQPVEANTKPAEDVNAKRDGWRFKVSGSYLTITNSSSGGEVKQPEADTKRRFKVLRNYPTITNGSNEETKQPEETKLNNRGTDERSKLFTRPEFTNVSANNTALKLDGTESPKSRDSTYQRRSDFKQPTRTKSSKQNERRFRNSRFRNHQT